MKGQLTTIVTAGNSEYWNDLSDLIKSIRGKAGGAKIPIQVFDIGLSDSEATILKKDAVSVLRPDWPFEFSEQERCPAYLKAMAVRPFIPRYIPGFHTYIWLDSDCWIQDWGTIDTLVEGSRDRSLAIVPELDRAHIKDWQRFIDRTYRNSYDLYGAMFGEEIAKMFFKFPVLNSGVFALQSDAPHWQIWMETVAAAFEKLCHHLTEQTALNYVVYNFKLKTTYLPFSCNWLCSQITPRFDSLTNTFQEPDPPFGTIGIMHLSGKARKNETLRFSRTRV